MSLQPTIGHLRPDSDRAEMWRAIYGSLDVPLEGPLPYLSLGPDGLPDYHYKIKVAALTDEQLDALCRFIAEKFDHPIEVVREGVLGNHGIPIRASELAGGAFDARLVM